MGCEVRGFDFHTHGFLMAFSCLLLRCDPATSEAKIIMPHTQNPKP